MTFLHAMPMSGYSVESREREREREKCVKTCSAGWLGLHQSTQYEDLMEYNHDSAGSVLNRH